MVRLYLTLEEVKAILGQRNMSFRIVQQGNVRGIAALVRKDTHIRALCSGELTLLRKLP